MSSKITKETFAIEKAMGEKIGFIALAWVSFTGMMAGSFVFGWKFTLILLGLLPILAIFGIIMGFAMKGGAVAEMRAYA